MGLDLADRRTRYFLWGGLVLVAGLSLAGWIYLAAVRQAAADLAQADTSILMLNPEHSKKFLHDLQVYGGKANVLMFKFKLWLEEVFQGKSLAAIIATLSLLVSGGLFYAGSQASDIPPSGSGPDQSENQPAAPQA